MEQYISTSEKIAKEQAGTRVTIRAKIKEGSAPIYTLTSHYSSVEEFIQSMTNRNREIISYEVV